MEAKKIATFQYRFSELIDSSPKSRSAIAAEFGVAKQTISAWTTGQSSPRLPVVYSLAEYFGVNYEWLLGFDVPKYPAKEKPPDDHPKTKEAQILAKGIDRLPPEQRAQALAVVRAMFSMHADYFEGKEDPSDDT